MKPKILVAILDDHHSIVDGYKYRLDQYKDIAVVGIFNYGDDLLPFLSKNRVDVLILDISVPTNPRNSNPYPILFTIPRLLRRYPDMRILVISMHNQSSIILAVLDADVSGYIFKDDRATLSKLGEVIRAVSEGNLYFSRQVLSKTSNISTPESFLTSRQLEVLSLCASSPGATADVLAEMLGVAPSTFRNLLSGIYKSLNVSNRTEAILNGRQLGLITPDDPGI
jgi:DNA-binding NarL/FixJ family response regulator